MSKLQILTRVKRINKRNGIFETDSEKGPGDLYYITKYISDNNVMITSSWGNPRVDEGQSLILTDDNNRVYGKEENKEEIIAFYNEFMKKAEGWAGIVCLTLGEHTYFPSERYKTYPFWGNIRYVYDRPHGAKKLPIIKYDYTKYIPEDTKDEKGGFKFSLDNLKKVRQACIEERGNQYAGLAYCNGCRQYKHPEQFQDSHMKKMIRRGHEILFEAECLGCHGTIELNASPVYLTEPSHITQVSNALAQVKLSDDYYVERRMSTHGSRAKAKLRRVGMDNKFTFTHNNWGTALLSSCIEYAKKLDIPIEVQ